MFHTKLRYRDNNTINYMFNLSIDLCLIFSKSLHHTRLQIYWKDGFEILPWVNIRSLTEIEKVSECVHVELRSLINGQEIPVLSPEFLFNNNRSTHCHPCTIYKVVISNK